MRVGGFTTRNSQIKYYPLRGSKTYTDIAYAILQP